MTLARQGSGAWPVAMPAHGDHKAIGIQRGSPGHSRMYDGGVRGGSVKPPSRLSKGKRAPQQYRPPPGSAACVSAVCLVILVAVVLSSQLLIGGVRFSQLDDVFGKQDRQQLVRRRSEYRGRQGPDVKEGKILGIENSGSDALDWFDNGGVHNEIGSFEDRDIAKKQESGSLYNEGGRDELVEIGARYEDRHASNEEKEEIAGEELQRRDSHHVKLDLDEYDDDGGDEAVEKKPEVMDENEELRRMAELRGAGDHIQTVAGAVEEVPEQISEGTDKHQLYQEVIISKDQDTGGISQASVVQKVPRPKKRRHSATSPCEIDFLRTTDGLQEPEGDAFVNISLSYVESEERPLRSTDWVPKFGGHQSLLEREESFHAKDQTLHCGFVKASDGESWTGFELSEDDKEYLSHCHIAVSSCIFGAWDNLRTPTNKKLSNSSKVNVCFVMFVDQKSLDVILEGAKRTSDKGILGLWKIVLIKNLPYLDGRRNGKVPKFLTHRLFPNARYSIWLDSKLRLHADPLLILERFLWRGKNEYAISNHYDRHCVWEEVARNKRLNKYNHSVIDEQFRFYQREGLPRFNRTDPNRFLPSHVPEGSFIVRAHTPMSNLFSCLWYNEVERFTPRDQLSFAATYIKLARMNPTKRFRLNMFKDCERKAMAKLYRHRVGAGNAVTHI